MRIDRAAIALALLFVATGVAATPARAQDPLTEIRPTTEVASIAFRFEGEESLPAEDLQTHIALTARGGMVGLRRALSFLPFITPIGSHPFDPVVLQRDVVRLREYYHRSGFPHADVRYDVRFDAEEDLVDVEFIIDEGPPLRLDSLAFAPVGEAPPLEEELAPELVEDWRGLAERERETVERYGEIEGRRLADRTGEWLRNRGYPFADAEATAVADTVANLADVTVRVRLGPRSRIRAIEVTGNESVRTEGLVRQLPIGVGDWYSASRLETGRQQLVQLEIVRLAIVEVPRELADDSSVVVRLRVTENPPHLITAAAGFASEGGLSAQADWTHRSLFGGARTLTVSTTAQTGVLALELPAQRLLRLGAVVFQPYVLTPRLSATGGPFVEYRDDLRDRSWAVGLEGSLVYAIAPLRSASLGYSFSTRRILDYRFGEYLSGQADYLTLLGLAAEGTLDSLGSSLRRSVVSLNVNYGALDDLANPARGYVVRPRIEVAVPGGFNTEEYMLLDVQGSGFLPLTGAVGLAVRVGAGRVYPFGKSLPSGRANDGFLALLRLRDVLFTAGGTRDVRGWGSQLLGPKIPDIRLDPTSDSTPPTAERYAPIGGLARLSGTIELRMPLPGFTEAWQTFVFLDGGRVWTPDSRFSPGGETFDQERFFYSTGGGLSYETVVGAVQFSLGYKLNPSAFDVRPAGEVLDALLQGEPIASVPASNSRRLHLHFSIGAAF